MEFIKIFFYEYRWFLYSLPFIVLIIRFFLIKKDSDSKFLAHCPFILLGLCFIIDVTDTPNQDTALLAFYMVALGLIEYLIDENKKTFSRTTFYDQYSKIEKEWESFGEKTPNVEEKKCFIIQSLEAIENCITAPEVKENSICKKKPEIEEFVTQSGGMNANYFWMCCNKDQFYKNVLVSLYSNLFLQLNKKILEPIQLNAAGTAVQNCYVPEFVSTELTRTLLANPDILFQYNTSVSSIASYAKDNCARSIDRGSNSNVVLRRIIIYDSKVNYNQDDLNTVCKWHEDKDNNVELRFIEMLEAENAFCSQNYQGKKDFSVIGMGNSCVLLEAQKRSKEPFAGFNHDMYELNFRVDNTKEAKKMFETLWRTAKKYIVNNNNYSIV